MKALHYVLAPVALPQALWLKRSAVPMTEPDGPRSGHAGQGRPVRLLITGDSSAAGVGVAHQDDALSGQLVHRLAVRHAVDWALHAKCGSTVGTTIERLQEVAAAQFDACVIGLGVNDAKNGHTVAAFTSRYGELIDLLRTRFGVRCIYCSGLPPVRQFPLLKWPTREVVGTRVELFDEALREIVEDHAETCRYLDFTMQIDASVMAEDGFHPGPPVYAEWARIADLAIARDFGAAN